MDGIAPTLTIWTESGGGVTSPKEMLDVVTRRENDDQQAKITDAHYTHQPRLDSMPNFVFITTYWVEIFVACVFLLSDTINSSRAKAEPFSLYI